MDELTIGNKTYISSKRAAQITGYAKDYVGQLCREGRVEARLVGRSWYVLEDAIRAHRFGEEAKSSEKVVPSISEPTKVETEWQPAVYKPEPTASMPEFPKRPESISIKQEDVPVATADIERSETLSEMQAAWREWFTRKEELLLEAHASDSRERSEVEQESDVHVSKVATEEVVVEEPVTVRKVTYVPQNEVRRPVATAVAMDVRPIMKESKTAPTRPEVKIAPRGSRSGSGLALKAFFVAVAAIAVAVTVVGSGYADQYLGKDSGQLDYFRGASTFERESK